MNRIFTILIVSAMVLGIVSFIVILLVAIPLGGIGVIAVITGKTAGLTWNAYTITLAVIAGAFLILIILYALALISVPVIVFFPAYSIHFFASRYRPLDALLHPAPPVPQVSFMPETPPQPPPPVRFRAAPRRSLAGTIRETHPDIRLKLELLESPPKPTRALLAAARRRVDGK